MKVGVVLAGCGYLDGAEITEAVSTLIALSSAGADYQCFAPDAPQLHVINHALNVEAPAQQRNVLEEAARIARGKVLPLSEASAATLDALIFPGGFGAAKNLCDYAVTGRDCTVRADVAALIEAVHAAGKPLGFICISPVIGARVLGPICQPTLTIGSDAATAGDIEHFGAKHQSCAVDACVVDNTDRVVSTPAYMYEAQPGEVFAGVSKLVAAVLALAGRTRSAAQ